MGLSGDSAAHISRVDFSPSYPPVSTSKLIKGGNRRCARKSTLEGEVARREIDPGDVCRGIPAEAHFHNFAMLVTLLGEIPSDFAEIAKW